MASATVENATEQRELVEQLKQEVTALREWKTEVGLVALSRIEILQHSSQQYRYELEDVRQENAELKLAVDTYRDETLGFQEMSAELAQTTVALNEQFAIVAEKNDEICAQRLQIEALKKSLQTSQFELAQMTSEKIAVQIALKRNRDDGDRLKKELNDSYDELQSVRQAMQRESSETRQRLEMAENAANGLSQEMQEMRVSHEPMDRAEEEAILSVAFCKSQSDVDTDDSIDSLNGQIVVASLEHENVAFLGSDEVMEGIDSPTCEKPTQSRHGRGYICIANSTLLSLSFFVLSVVLFFVVHSRYPMMDCA